MRRPQAWQRKHSGCQTAPMRLKCLSWPISRLHRAQILQMVLCNHPCEVSYDVYETDAGKWQKIREAPFMKLVMLNVQVPYKIPPCWKRLFCRPILLTSKWNSLNMFCISSVVIIVQQAQIVTDKHISHLYNLLSHFTLHFFIILPIGCFIVLTSLVFV